MCKSILLSSPEANLLGVRGLEIQQKHRKIQGDNTCLDCLGSGQDKEIIVKTMKYTRLKCDHTFQIYAQSLQIAVNNNENCCTSRRGFRAHGLFGGQRKTLHSIVKIIL